MRIGVGHPGNKDRVIGHVLKDFGKAEADWRDRLLDALAREVPLLIAGDDAGYMSKVALAVKPPRPKAGKDNDNGGADGVGASEKKD